MENATKKTESINFYFIIAAVIVSGLLIIALPFIELPWGIERDPGDIGYIYSFVTLIGPGGSLLFRLCGIFALVFLSLGFALAASLLVLSLLNKGSLVAKKLLSCSSTIFFGVSCVFFGLIGHFYIPLLPAVLMGLATFLPERKKERTQE
ncbi:MAG: hypothetical protein J6328_03050 [Bacilli bacterium]|nr:hypothetical protein [Bacilli bacterium]